MRGNTRLVTVLATAGLVAAGIVGSASAAPAIKGTTYISPTFAVEGTARPGQMTDRGAAFGIVGHVKDGTIKHAGGINVRGYDGMLWIRNLTIDLNTDTVSGMVNGTRADLFELTVTNVSEDGDTTVALAFTEAASMAVVGDASITGLPAGTATVDLY